MNYLLKDKCYEIHGVDRKMIDDLIERVTKLPLPKNSSAGYSDNFAIVHNKYGKKPYPYGSLEHYRGSMRNGEIVVDFCESDIDGFVTKLNCELIVEEGGKTYTVRQWRI